MKLGLVVLQGIKPFDGCKGFFIWKERMTLVLKLEKLWDVVVTEAPGASEGELIDEHIFLEAEDGRKDGEREDERELRARAILLHKLGDGLLMRVKDYTASQVWAYLRNEFGALTNHQLMAVESSIKNARYHVGDNFDKLVCRLQESFNELEESSSAYPEARKIAALCNCFTDSRFQVLVTLVMHRAKTFTEAATTLRSELTITGFGP